MQKSEGGHYGVLPSHALSLKGKLELLKVKGLQEVLQSLGLSKQGRKLELISRILLACADESSVRARTVDGLVGQLLGWSSAGGGGAASAAAAHPVATAGSATSTAPRGRVRCLCIDASAAMQRDLVSCRECGCLQHAVCVELRVGDKTHTCELCRLRDVDPTVEPVGESARLSLLFPHCQSPMMTSSRRMAGTLRLSQAELALLSCPDHQIRLYVLDVRPQVNYHRWPVGLVVGVNGVDVDLRLPPAAWDGVTNRYKTRVVDEVGILSAQREVRWTAANSLVASCVQQSSCALVALLVRTLSAEQLAERVRQSSPLVLDVARARMLGKCFPGGDDDDLQQMAVNLALRCPLSLMRIGTAVRSKACRHTECFDLASHISMQLASKAPRWACPLCTHTAKPRELEWDCFVQSLLDQSADKGFTEIELQPDGSWKAPKQKDETPRVKRQRPSAGPPPSAAVYDLGDDDEPPPSTLRSSLQLPSTLPVSVLPAPGFFRAQFGVPSLLGTGSMPLPLPLPLSLAGLMDAGSMGSGSMLLPAAGLLLPSMQPALPLPAHAQSAAEGAGGGAPSAAGLLSGGVTRNGVTAQHMTRVLADACAMAAESRQILSLDASPQAHPAYRQIHDLFLSLEDNPRSADALCFAHEQALTLLGHGRPFGELQPAASPPAASLFALDPSFPPLFLAAAGGVGGVGVGAQDGAAAGARIYAAFAVAPLPALLPPPPVARAPPPPIARVQMPPAVRAAGPGEDPDNPICLD